mgnify:FL=1
MNKFKFGDKVFCKGLFGDGIYHKRSYHGSDEPMCYVLFENYGLKVVELASITKVSDWIPCSERMPEYDSEVIVENGNYILNDKCYDFGDGLCFYDDNDSSVTHWMPLPEMPEVKE